MFYRICMVSLDYEAHLPEEDRTSVIRRKQDKETLETLHLKNKFDVSDKEGYRLLEPRRDAQVFPYEVQSHS